MPEFKDAGGQSWNVELDGLLLAELREKLIVDIVQDGLYFIEQREDVLTKTLLAICREQREDRKLSERQFSKLISGATAEAAFNAVRGAAELFFRPSRWSEIQSRSEKKKELETLYRDLQPMLEMLNRPEMPKQMREAVMAAIGEKIEAATSSANFDGNPSASGQAAIPVNVAGELLDSLAVGPKA